MKFCRFVPSDPSVSAAAPLYATLEEDELREIPGPPWAPQQRLPSSRSWKRAAVRLVAPVEPGKVVCIGRNYAAHAAELGNEVPKEPLLFLKPSSSIVGPEEPILLTPYSHRVEHEGELAIIIGQPCSHLRDSDDALSYVLGYTCLNDVTARDIQKSDAQFTPRQG